ncbi:MAG TPA: acetyl-CoA carboxylase biotin carboxyl carrier protein subunit [Oceanipulchritudo sp.]|nr:acetyl-CoA carboxylase biotin carboxyl carrier protein subunit [Oceanipulchritudo sp.]
MNYSVRCGRKHSVVIDRKSDFGRPFEVSVGKTKHTLQIRKVQEDGTLKTLMIDHRVCPVEIERRGDGMPVRVFLKGVPYEVDISRMASTRFRPPLPKAEVSGEVRASLPGQIVGILVEEGQRVAAGDPLVILDAMKMENEITAPMEGVVKSVHIRPGQVLAKGDLMLEIDPQGG